MSDERETNLDEMMQQAQAQMHAEARWHRSKERQKDRITAIGLAASLQLVEGLGLTAIEEIRKGYYISDELIDGFNAALNNLVRMFEKVCKDYKEEKK